MGNRNFRPARFLALGFALIILAGALLLCLPAASRTGEATPFLTCLFTATSATCVTGLVVVDTYLHWSTFGQGVVLCLIQLGGLGFISVLTLASLALRRRIGLTQRLAMASAMGLNSIAGVVRVVRRALIGTFLLELCGAMVLATQMVPRFGWGQGVWFSIFHSVSAFCNGGFDLLGDYTGAYSSLVGFTANPVVLLTIMVLIVLGGLGFFVWEDVLAERRWKGLTIYSRMVLSITGGLIVLGTAFFLWTEWDNPGTLGTMDWGEKLLNALFQSVTLRTAGYATLNQGALSESAGAFSVLYMLIGGSSGSTAGGIKTVTAGVLLLALRAGLRGQDQVVVRGRTIPQERVLSAMTLTLLAGLAALSGAMILSLAEGAPFLTCIFETSSAIGTVGLTMGITPELSALSQAVLILLMYLGRVGILSFSMAFLLRRPGVNKITYPNTDVLIG